jgi:glutathione S-transferase
MLSLLGLPSEFILVDLKQGAHKTAGFTATINRFGQVPAIDDDGTVLADSNAILVYLATKYGKGQWLPSDPVGQARVQRWLSAAAGQLHAGPATARLAVVFGADVDAAAAISRAHALLALMEQQLSETRFLAGEQPSIADIAFYTYVAHAPEGNVSLADYPKVRAWLASIEALPGFVGMPRTAVGLQSQ